MPRATVCGIGEHFTDRVDWACRHVGGLEFRKQRRTLKSRQAIDDPLAQRPAVDDTRRIRREFRVIRAVLRD